MGTDGPAVLLVRPDHLGDLLLTLPAALYLRRALPSARLTYLVSSGLVDITARCPAVDLTVGVPFPDPGADVPPQPFWDAVSSAEPELSRHDAALLLRPNDPVGGAVVSRLGIPVRIGFAQSGTRPFLTSAVQEPHGHHAALGYRLVDELLRRLDYAAPEARPFDWDTVVDDVASAQILTERPEDSQDADAVLGALEHVAGSRPIVIHPGSGWRLKNWGPERWGRLARATSERYGHVALVTGTASEGKLCGAVVGQAGGGAVSLAGRLALGGFASLLRRSRVLVSVDSGPLHLAALVGCPVVGLYGPVTERAAGPLCHQSRRRTLGVRLPCRPCGQMIDPPCGATRDPACISGIELNDVITSLDALVATSSTRR
jgi:heptosyltransferase-3